MMKIQRHFKLNCKDIYLDNVWAQRAIVTNSMERRGKTPTSFLKVDVALSSKKEKSLWGKSLQLLGPHVQLMLSGYTSNYLCNMTTPIHLAVISEAIRLLYTYIQFA